MQSANQMFSSPTKGYKPATLTGRVSPPRQQASANYRLASSLNASLVHDRLNLAEEKKSRADTYGLLREKAGNQKPKNLLRAERNCARYFSNLGSANDSSSHTRSKEASPKLGHGAARSSLPAML